MFHGEEGGGGRWQGGRRAQGERREEEGGGRNLRGRPGRACPLAAGGAEDGDESGAEDGDEGGAEDGDEGGAEPAAASWRWGWARMSSGGRGRSTASGLGHSGELQRAAKIDCARPVMKLLSEGEAWAGPTCKWGKGNSVAHPFWHAPQNSEILWRMPARMRHRIVWPNI